MNENRTPSRSAICAELARRSLAEFFRESWSILEPTTPLIWNWHLQAICDHVQALLEGRIPKGNLYINVPPGSSKSRIVSVCTTAWWWIDHPGWRGIYSSRNPRNVIRDSIYCRDLIESKWYQEWFQPTWRLTKDQNAKTLYRTTEGGFRQAVTSGAKVTGDRANGLFMDDMLDAAEGESKTAHLEFENFYNNAFRNRVSDMKTGTRCMIAQRLHENDPVGHVIRSGDWEGLVIRQEYEQEKENPHDQNSKFIHPRPTSLGWSDPRKTPGELMDPIRFPAEQLEKEKRALGTRGYHAQHQQRPAPAEGAILKRGWFKWYQTPKGADGRPLPPAEICKVLGITRVIQGVDTAQTEKTSADFTADITIGQAPSRYYVLDLFKDKIESPVVKATVIALQAKWKAAAVIIEGGSSASGKAVAQSIKSSTALPVIEMPVVSDKVVGMNSVAPTVEAGTIYLPEDAPWIMEFLESLLAFPVGAHDDDCDAFRIALRYILFGTGTTGLLDFARQQMEAAKKP